MDRVHLFGCSLGATRGCRKKVRGDLPREGEGDDGVTGFEAGEAKNKFVGCSRKSGVKPTSPLTSAARDLSGSRWCDHGTAFVLRGSVLFECNVLYIALHNSRCVCRVA